MALSDVVYNEGDIQNFIVEIGSVMSGAVNDILFESGTGSGTLISELVLTAGGGNTYSRGRIVNA